MKFLAERYVDDVLSGKVVACHWVKRACQRHRVDLEHGHERGLWFDKVAAKTAVAFFPTALRHWKGEWADKPVDLEPFQQFIVWSLCGWKRTDNTRRFRSAYLEIARKNGKTTLAAGLGLWLAFAEGEPGAEVYTAATKRDQARIAHRDASEMVKKSPFLNTIQSVKDNLHDLDSGSKFEPLGRDADSTDGLNVHAVIADELHAWKTRDLWDKLETATGSRRQPLMVSITTAGAGNNRNSICYLQNEYAKRVLDGIVEDDTLFALIFTIDEADDWADESVWVKANPNLGVSKKWDDMKRLAKRATEMPTQLNAFLRLHLNVWTQAVTRWVNPRLWDACGKLLFDEEDLVGRVCYAGLDLSSRMDVAGYLLVFPPVNDDDHYYVLPRFFIPEDNMAERVKNDRVPYDVWERAGLLVATSGNVIDYGFIIASLFKDLEQFQLAELAFDPWGATFITNQLQDEGSFVVDEDEMEVGKRPLLVEMRQGFRSLSEPMKELETLIASERLAHGGHPVLTWMADNLVARTDPAGNIKPDKEKSREKIDGMVALIMGLGRAMLHKNNRGSVYGARGIRTL